MWTILNLLITVAILALNYVFAGLNEGGPHHVVGYFTEQVTLYCNRSAPGGVTWAYIAPGAKQEQQVPGKHRYLGSSYGQHELRLENLKRSDAGMYVCRSSHVPQAFDPASAFVVVVANRPICLASYKLFVDASKVTVSCRITYNGLLNLTLSISGTDDNRTIATHNYTSLVQGSWWHLEKEVRVNSGVQQYACTAKFYSSKTDADIAKNHPADIEVQCEPPPSQSEQTRGSNSVRSTSQTAGPSNQTTVDGILHNTSSFLHNTEGAKRTNPTGNGESASNIALSMSAVALVLVLGLIIFAVVLLIRRRWKQKRESVASGGEQPGVNESNDANQSMATLLGDKADSKLPQTSSTTYSTDRDLTLRSVSHPRQVHPSCSFSTSGSDASLSLVMSLRSVDDNHDTDDADDESDSNQNTVVPSDRQNLAAAAVAARPDNRQ